jgi:hypothetical protein
LPSLCLPAIYADSFKRQATAEERFNAQAAQKFYQQPASLDQFLKTIQQIE